MNQNISKIRELYKIDNPLMFLLRKWNEIFNIQGGGNSMSIRWQDRRATKRADDVSNGDMKIKAI